jgi:Signal transduction histidine kinase
MKSTRKIAEALRHYNILVTVFAFTIVGLVYLTSEYIKFTQNQHNFREEKLREQKAILYQEVNKAIKTINFHKTTFFITLCNKMRDVVTVGQAAKVSLVNASYNQVDSPCSDKVTTCLKSVFSLEESHLNQVFNHEFVAIDTFPQSINEVETHLQNFGEVFFFQTDTQLLTKKAITRLFYLKKNPNKGVVFGVAVDWTKHGIDWQRETLEELSLIRFGKNGEGYIFINTYGGDPLLTNGMVTVGNKNIWNLEDPNGNKVIQMEFEAAQKLHGDYIFYSWRKVAAPDQKAYSVDSLIYPKVSFVKGIPQLKWIVGAGVYMDDIEADLSQIESLLFRDYLRSIFFFFVLILFSLVFSYVLTYRFSEQLELSTQKLIKFLQTIASNPSSNPTVDFKFVEYKSIAEIARKLETHRALVESSFSQLVELNPDSIAIVEGENFIYLNKSWLKNLGYNLEEIPTLDAFFSLAYWNEEYRLNLKEKWHSFIGADSLDGQSMIDLKLNGKDGIERFFGIRVIKLLNDRLMVVLTDLTEIKEHQHQLLMAKRHAEEADRLKSAFLANMSHEIRTPMNSIVGFTSLLQRDNISEEKKEKYIKLIQSSSNSLLTLINDIIDISKLESGQISIVFELTDVTKILSEVFSVHKVLFEKMGQANLKLTLSCPGSLIIKVDPQRLRQVLVNLIHNAYKFTDEGRVDFGFLPFDADATFVTFYCSDTGCGISPEQGNRIFERFISYDTSGAKVHSGTGLGLAISKNLIELMGGKIWFESQEKKGTTFFFNLPLSL